MSMVLPSGGEGLINALLVLTAGDVFPKADEDMLRSLANTSRAFGNNLNAEVSGLDSLVASVVQGLDTSAGRQFARYGHNLDEFGTGLIGQAKQIGDILEDFGLNAENAKYQIVIGATITASMIAWAFASPWGAALIPTYEGALRTFVVDVITRYTNTMTMMLWGAATESAQELGSAFLSQLIQVLEGNRKTFDAQDLGISAGVGAGAGFIAPLIGAVITAAPSVFKKQWREVGQHIIGIDKPPTPPSTVFRLTTNTLTEAVTELVVSAATLPLGGSLTGLGFSTVSGIFSGFTETAAEITGERLHEKHHTPPPPPPGGGGPHGKPNQGVHDGQNLGASQDDDGPPPLVTGGGSSESDPNDPNGTSIGSDDDHSARGYSLGSSHGSDTPPGTPISVGSPPGGPPTDIEQDGSGHLSSDTDPADPNSLATSTSHDDPLGLNQQLEANQPPTPGSNNTAIGTSALSEPSSHGSAASFTGNAPPASGSSAPAGNNSMGGSQQSRSSDESTSSSTSSQSLNTGSGLENATHNAAQPSPSALSSEAPDEFAPSGNSTSYATAASAPPSSTSGAAPASTTNPASTTRTDSTGQSVVDSSSLGENLTHSPSQSSISLSGDTAVSGNTAVTDAPTIDGDIDSDRGIDEWREEVAEMTRPQLTMRVLSGRRKAPSADSDSSSSAPSDLGTSDMEPARSDLERSLPDSDWTDSYSGTIEDETLQSGTWSDSGSEPEEDSAPSQPSSSTDSDTSTSDGDLPTDPPTDSDPDPSSTGTPSVYQTASEGFVTASEGSLTTTEGFVTAPEGSAITDRSGTDATEEFSQAPEPDWLHGWRGRNNDRIRGWLGAIEDDDTPSNDGRSSVEPADSDRDTESPQSSIFLPGSEDIMSDDVNDQGFREPTDDTIDTTPGHPTETIATNSPAATPEQGPNAPDPGDGGSSSESSDSNRDRDIHSSDESDRHPRWRAHSIMTVSSDDTGSIPIARTPTPDTDGMSVDTSDDDRDNLSDAGSDPYFPPRPANPSPPSTAVTSTEDSIQGNVDSDSHRDALDTDGEPDTSAPSDAATGEPTPHASSPDTATDAEHSNETAPIALPRTPSPGSNGTLDVDAVYDALILTDDDHLSQAEDNGDSDSEPLPVYRGPHPSDSNPHDSDSLPPRPANPTPPRTPTEPSATDEDADSQNGAPQHIGGTPDDPDDSDSSDSSDSGDDADQERDTDDTDTDSDDTDTDEDQEDEQQEDDEEELENPPNTSIDDNVSERRSEVEPIDAEFNAIRREYLERLERLNRILNGEDDEDDDVDNVAEEVRPRSPIVASEEERPLPPTHLPHEQPPRTPLIESTEERPRTPRPESPPIVIPKEKRDSDQAPAGAPMYGRERIRRAYRETESDHILPRVHSTRPAIVEVNSAPDEPPQGGLPRFQQNVVMESEDEGADAQNRNNARREPESKLPAGLDWRKAQEADEARRAAERDQMLLGLQGEMARRQAAQEQGGNLRPPTPQGGDVRPPTPQGGDVRPPTPQGDPEQDIEVDPPPSDAIVSVGVPKGRLPATKGLIRTIKSEFRQLRNKPEAFWTNFERELLSKYRQIAFDMRRRRQGAPPPVSHAFQIDGVTLFISLALAYDRRLPDASAARDGIPGEPGRDKTGAVEGVDIVNGQYDLGTTDRAMTGDTTYTALSLNPNFAFPKDTWRPGLNVGIEADINRSQRSIGNVRDAEKGGVEDARVAVEYLVYRPRWVVRVLNPNLTFRLVRSPRLFPAPGDDEVLVLGVAQPYVQQPRLEEVVEDAPDPLADDPLDDDEPEDDVQDPNRTAPVVNQDPYLRAPRPAKLIKKDRPAQPQRAPIVPPAPLGGPDRRFSALPDHYFVSGLTGIDKLYQHALGLLRRNNLNDVDTASIVTRLWTLEANLHNATRRGGGYRFPVFNNNAQIIALFEINTTLFPGGFEAANVNLAHDDAGANAPTFTVEFPPTELIGSVSNLVHIEDVATSIDGLSGGHTLSQSIAGSGGFTAFVKQPGNSDVGMGAVASLGLKTGNTNGISASRTSLWVHVARFVGRTGAYSVPMVHQIRLIDPATQYQPARTVPGVAMIRVPESEAARRNWPLEPESPFRVIEQEEQGRRGNIKDFGHGAGMALVRLNDDTVTQLFDLVEEELAREGIVHGEGLNVQNPTATNDGVRRHKQLENAVALQKLVSQAALRANYDMAHQGGYTFTLDVPAENVLPHVPSMPGLPGRMKSARVTIFATKSNDRADNTRRRDPEFVRTTGDYTTVNLAMGMTTVGQNVGGSVGFKGGGKFSIAKGILKNFGVVGGGYAFTRGANNEAKLLNNRPELLEYAHEVEEWRNHSDWHVQVEVQDAPILTRTLPPSRLLNMPRRLMHQEATVHTLDFINGWEKRVAPLNPGADLQRRHPHFMDNVVVYKLDTTEVRRELTRMMRPFTGPANAADQAVRTLAGVTNMRASLKEVLRGGIFTELPFIPGWFKDKHGSASIKATMLDVQFDGTTRDSFTLGIIRLGLISTSMGHNESHAWGSDMFDFNLGAQVNTADLSGGISSEHKQTWGTSKNVSREGAFERIQLKFGPAYKFRVGLRYRLETSVEYGGKFVPGNLIADVTRQRPAVESPEIAPAVLEAALEPDRRMRAPLPQQTPDGARVALPGAPGRNVADDVPEQRREDQYFDVDSYVEFLVPERDALHGFVLDALPLTSPQLIDVMTRFRAARDGAPPISGDLAARVLLRWSQLEDRAEIHGFARDVLTRHRDGDPRYYVVNEEVLRDLVALAPQAELLPRRNPPFRAPAYLVGGRPQDRILGHTGITSVTYQRYDDAGRFVRDTSLYEMIKDAVYQIDRRALGYDVVVVGNQEQTRSKLKPIQGVSEGLSGVFGRGRDEMFIDDFLHDKGLTFALVHPVNWFNAEILEISVQMRLKDDYQWGDVAPVAGTENFTHGYTGQSSTVSKSDSFRVNGKFTASRAPETHVGLGSGRASVNNGYSRSLSNLATNVSEQTVFDWGGHVRLDIAHETIVTVRRYYMNQRWLNNLSLAIANRGTVLAVHERKMHGTLSLEVPMSIATGHQLWRQPEVRSEQPYVGKLPGDATVAGNTLDGLMPAAQRMLDRIEGKFWTISNARNAVSRFLGIEPFKSNPSAIMQSLLARTQLNGHIPAAIGGGVHRLAENMIIPGHPDYLIDIDMVGELIRHDQRETHRPTVLLEMTGNGSGRYDKTIRGVNHSLKVDNMKGSLGLDAGYNYNRDVRAPDAKDPRIDQIVGGGLENTRAITTGTSGTENRNRRDEAHLKQLVNRAADPNNEDADFESMYSVRFVGRFQLTANVRNQNLPAAINPWTETFRTNWVEGYVYVTLTKSQYMAMMNTDYATPDRFMPENDIDSGDPSPPESRYVDERFEPSGDLPEGFMRPAAWRPIEAPGYAPANRLHLHGPPGAGVPARPPRPHQASQAPLVVPISDSPPAPHPFNFNMNWNPVPPIHQSWDAPPPGTHSGLRQPLPYNPLLQGQIGFDPTVPPPPIVPPVFGQPLRFDPLAPVPGMLDQTAPPPPFVYPPFHYDALAPGGESPRSSSPSDSQIFNPRMPPHLPSRHQAPGYHADHLNRMRHFFAAGGRSELADRLTAALDRYAYAGILDHFADLPGQDAADLALAQLMRDTEHLDNLDAVWDALQLFDRANMTRRFHERSSPGSADHFMAEFMRHLDPLLRGFYVERGQVIQSPRRSMSPIQEEAEDDYMEQLHTGQVPFDRNSSDERRSTAGRTPWAREQMRINLPPQSSSATHMDSFELLNRQQAGQEGDPNFLDDPEGRQLPPQQRQRQRVLEMVRVGAHLARPLREHQIRFFQLAHAGVADVLDNLPNRDLADQVMARMILHGDNLAAAFNRIAPDQVNRLFANGTRWEARNILWLLENIRDRPYPVHEQRDIWAFVESELAQHAR